MNLFHNLDMEMHFLSRVNFLMLKQIGFSGERFPTFQAGEWLLPRVSSQMFDQSQFLGKTFPALHTGKQILSCVNSLVLNQVRFVLKAPAAFHARELSLHVSLQMRQKIRFPGETLRTF